jgi:hypothetical protein
MEMRQAMNQIELLSKDVDQEQFEAPTWHDEHLRKHVNAIALMPTKGGGKITAFSRTLYNVLLYRAQKVGNREEYSARMHEIAKEADFDSNNTEHIKKTLRGLIKTIVEWQSPSSGETEEWDACGMLSGVSIKKDRRTKAVDVYWRYDSKIREQLLNPDRYARFVFQSSLQLRSHQAKALYEICARYVDNPAHKTARQHWRWWRPVLCGQAYDDEKGEYRYFKRDILQPAIAEINQNTELEIKLLPEFRERDNRTVSDLQFEVRFKNSSSLPVATPKPLKNLEQVDLKLIGQAVALGIKQSDAEKLMAKHGSESLGAGLQDLEQRMALPKEQFPPVEKPVGYLRTILKPKVAKTNSATSTRPPSTFDFERNKAALMEEWLRAKRDEMRSLFTELPEVEQKETLAMFRGYLERERSAMVKRFDTSGWNHRSLRDLFSNFLGEQWHGPEWHQASSDELLSFTLARTNSGA